MSEPKHPRWEKPVSSKTTTTTFGAPDGGVARGSQEGVLSAAVTPGPVTLFDMVSFRLIKRQLSRLYGLRVVKNVRHLDTNLFHNLELNSLDGEPLMRVHQYRLRLEKDSPEH